MDNPAGRPSHLNSGGSVTRIRPQPQPGPHRPPPPQLSARVTERDTLPRAKLRERVE
jgi:hypothetical protein